MSSITSLPRKRQLLKASVSSDWHHSKGILDTHWLGRFKNSFGTNHHVSANWQYSFQVDRD